MILDLETAKLINLGFENSVKGSETLYTVRNPVYGTMDLYLLHVRYFPERSLAL